MSLEEKVNQLAGLDGEIKRKQGQCDTLSKEIEALKNDCIKLQSDTDKEIAQKKYACDNECQEKKNESNNLLKQAQDKLAVANQRERDSEVIVSQIEKLEAKKKEISDLEKQAQLTLSNAAEKEHKANLLIEQYTKKLQELGVDPEKPKEEPKLEEKPKKNKK